MPETLFSYCLNAEMSIHTDGTLCQKILLSECWEISIPIKKYYAGEKNCWLNTTTQAFKLIILLPHENYLLSECWETINLTTTFIFYFLKQHIFIWCGSNKHLG